MPKCDKILKFQAAIYLAPSEYFLSKQMVNELNDFCIEHYKMSLLPLDIPSNAPPEIPRTIFTNHIQSLQLTISSSRIDFYHHPEKNIENNIAPIEFEQFIEEIHKLYAFINKILNPEINRIAIVYEFNGNTIEGEGDPLTWIKNKFFRTELDSVYFRNLENIILRIDKRTSMRSTDYSFSINKIFGIKTIRDSNGNGRILNYYLDINTIQDDKEIRFNEDQIKQFYVSSYDVLQKLLTLILK